MVYLNKMDLYISICLVNEILLIMKKRAAIINSMAILHIFGLSTI